jgi:chromosome segregation ATPase
MDGDAGGLMGGALGGGLAVWLIQRALTKFFDGGEKAERLGPTLEGIREDLREVKETLRRVEASVHRHDTDIEKMRADVDRLQAEKTDAHAKLWAKCDIMEARVRELELAQTSRRNRR